MASSYQDDDHACFYFPVKSGETVYKEGEIQMLMRGSQIVMECLLEQGVDTVFGYPGGTILNIYDEFELHGYKEKIHHYLTSHEQGASHAADGYARSTGKVGVCFATSGPGATNLVTGIATAYYDSSPVVFITCNVSENLIGKDSFQEVDITGITMPITKCNFLVKDAAQLADVIREAFAIARSGRPGPVLVDIAKNATAAMADYEPLPVSEHASHGRLANMLRRADRDLKNPEPDQGDIDKLLDLIEQSQRPMVLVGGGVIRSKHPVCATNRTGKLVAEATGLPVQLFLSHAHGGSQQIGARISYNEIDMVIFFNDPHSTELDDDLSYIVKLCDQHNVPIATNAASAEMLIHGLARGDLDWRDIVNPKKAPLKV